MLYFKFLVLLNLLKVVPQVLVSKSGVLNVVMQFRQFNISGLVSYLTVVGVWVYLVFGLKLNISITASVSDGGGASLPPGTSRG